MTKVLKYSNLLTILFVPFIFGMDEEKKGEEWREKLTPTAQVLLKNLDLLDIKDILLKPEKDTNSKGFIDLAKRIFMIGEKAGAISIAPLDKTYDLTLSREIFELIRNPKTSEEYNKNPEKTWEIQIDKLVETKPELVKAALINNFSKRWEHFSTNMMFTHLTKDKKPPTKEGMISFIQSLKSFTDTEHLKELSLKEENHSYFGLLFSDSAPYKLKLFDTGFDDFSPFNLIPQFNYLKLHFAPFSVTQQILQNFNRLLSFKLTVDDPEFSDIADFPLLFSSDGKTWDDKNNALLTILAQRIGKAFSLVQLMPSTENYKMTTSFGFFLTSLAKKFPPKMAPIFTVDSINSAEGGSSITIFRSEEALKTLTHEVLHAINLSAQFKTPQALKDYQSKHAEKLSLEKTILEKEAELKTIPDNEALQKEIHDLKTNLSGIYLPSVVFEEQVWLPSEDFCVTRLDSDSGLNINESLVEGAAAIFNVLFTAQEISSKELALKTAQEMWKYEKLFGLLQAAKILYLSGFKSFEDFLKPDITKERVQEFTSAAEYHILKSALTYNLEEFLSILINSTTDISVPIKKLIQRTIKDDKFIAVMNKLIQVAADIKKDSIFYKNGRLTVIERDLKLKVD